MAKKRKYTRVNVKSLKGAELTRYKKRLAAVRDYVRDKREWQKRASTEMTLQQYRDQKHGKGKAPTESEVMAMAATPVPKNGHAADTNAIVEKLERLLSELKSVQSKEQTLLSQLRSIAG